MLNDQDQELIAVAASIAAGCQPCTTFHFRAARIAGADDKEIRQAVSDALRVRRSATESMARTAGNYLDVASPDKSLIGELVSVSAAFAVNCVTDLETHLAAARQQGATDDQILTTLKIACAVKSMAGKKVEDAAARAMGGTEDRRDDCGCQGDKGMPGKMVQAAAAGATEGVGDRTDTCGCQHKDS